MGSWQHKGGTAEWTVAGTVSGFDAAAQQIFTSNMAMYLADVGVQQDHIALQVQAASVRVVSRIDVANSSIANTVASRLQHANPTTLSGVLGFTIERVQHVNIVILAPRPTAGGGGSNHVLPDVPDSLVYTVFGSAFVVLIVACLLVLCFCAWCLWPATRTRRRRSSSVVPLRKSSSRPLGDPPAALQARPPELARNRSRQSPVKRLSIRSNRSSERYSELDEVDSLGDIYHGRPDPSPTHTRPHVYESESSECQCAEMSEFRDRVRQVTSRGTGRAATSQTRSPPARSPLARSPLKAIASFRATSFKSTFQAFQKPLQAFI